MAREHFIRYRELFLGGRKVHFPASFTRKYAVTSTPGGRWKVRKTWLNGWRAYAEGDSRSFAKNFKTFELASNYAHAQAYIARCFSPREKSTRRDVQRFLFSLASRTELNYSQAPIQRKLLDIALRDVAPS